MTLSEGQYSIVGRQVRSRSLLSQIDIDLKIPTLPAVALDGTYDRRTTNHQRASVKAVMEISIQRLGIGGALGPKSIIFPFFFSRNLWGLICLDPLPRPPTK